MELFNLYSLGTNLCKGFTFEKALEIVKNSGFDYVEPSSIINMCEHIDPADITVQYASEIKELLHKKGLKCYAVSGHVDLTEERQFRDFLKKIEFTGRIGAKMINTNSGPVKRIDVFYENMKKIIEAAEKWDVIIGLESHGDIISTAKESVKVFEYFHHPLVRLNYDTGNVLFYSEGKADVAEDIKYGYEYLSHLHLKDISIQGRAVRYTPIGEGDVNFPEVFRSLREMGKSIPCGYEIPVHVKGVLGDIRPVGTPMDERDIYEAVRKSTQYVEEALQQLA